MCDQSQTQRAGRRMEMVQKWWDSLFQVGGMATVDLLNVSVQLSATLAQAFPNGTAGVLQVLRNMSGIPPGAGIHHGCVAVPLWKSKQHLLGASLTTLSVDSSTGCHCLMKT